MLWHVQPWPLLSCAHSCHYQHCHRAPLAAPPQWLLALTPMLFWVTPATFPVLSPVGAGSCLLHNSWGSAGSKHPPKGLLLPVWTAGCRGLESEGLPRPPGALGHLGCGCVVAQRVPHASQILGSSSNAVNAPLGLSGRAGVLVEFGSTPGRSDQPGGSTAPVPAACAQAPHGSSLCSASH